jgi:hypothetical protein
MRTALGIVLNGLTVSGDSSISPRYAPSPEMRQAMATRRATLRQALEPSPDAPIRAALFAMFLAFSTGRVAEEDAEAKVRLYTAELRSYPFWAIRDAIMAFRHGHVLGASMAFPPTGPQLLEEVRKRVVNTHVEIKQLTEAIEAKIIPERTEAEIALEREGIAKKAEATMRELNIIDRVTPENDAARRAREIEIITKADEANPICTIETPSGIKVSRGMRDYLDKFAAGMSSSEIKTGLKDPEPSGKHTD